MNTFFHYRMSALIVLLMLSAYSNIAIGQKYFRSSSTEQTGISSQIEKGQPFITMRYGAFEQVDISFPGMALKADSGSLLHDVLFVCSSIDKTEAPLLTDALIPVTGGAFAFRLLPHGEHFSVSRPARLEIGYEVQALPNGFTSQDIYTYYFDEQQKEWRQLRRLAVDTLQNVVISETTHFTDFVNAVIRTPEIPEERAFVPTSAPDLEEPHPLQGLVMMAAPDINNYGSAEMVYPIGIPAGRNGLQPDVYLSYSSMNGNGLLGYGWQMPQSAITMDTRWGVPRYDQTYESEIYTLDGTQLVLKDGNPDLKQSYQSNTQIARQMGDVRFIIRDPKNGDRIIRHGIRPADYWWEVVGRDGTIRYYGKYAADSGVNSKCVLKDARGNIGYWALAEVVDISGNFIRYEYVVSPSCEIYPKNIYYTGHRLPNDSVDMDPYYRIFFHYDQRPDVLKDGRLGFIRQTDSLLCYIDISYKDNGSNSGYTLPPNEFVGKFITNHRFVLLYNDFFNDNSSVSLLNQIQDHYNYHDAPWQLGIGCGIIGLNASGDVLNGKTSFDYHTSSLDNIFSDTVKILALPSPDLYLGISSDRSWNVGGTATVGLGTSIWNTNLSVGGNYNYSKSNGKTEQMLLDMNGDGLSDFVYIKDGTIRFCPQRVDTAGFGAEVNTYVPSKGLSNAVSQTHSWGLQVGVEAGVNANVSGGKSYTDTYTSCYFSDINGDGLPDYVSDGHVYFNRLNTHGGFLTHSGETEVILDSAQCVHFYYDGEVEFIPDCVVKDSVVSRFIFNNDCSLGYYGAEPDTLENIRYNGNHCEECDEYIREYIQRGICPINLHSMYANQRSLGMSRIGLTRKEDKHVQVRMTQMPDAILESHVLYCLSLCDAELPCEECLEFYHVEGLEDEYEQCKQQNGCRTLCSPCLEYLLYGNDEQSYLECADTHCLNGTLYEISTPCTDCEATCLDDIDNCRECIKNNPACMVCMECISECSGGDIETCIRCKQDYNCLGADPNVCFAECYGPDSDLYQCGDCMIANEAYCQDCYDTCLMYPELCRTCVTRHCHYDEILSYINECLEAEQIRYNNWRSYVLNHYHNIHIVQEGNTYYAHQIDTICPENTDPEIEAVRVWVAPRNGVLTLQSSIQLVEDTSVNRRQARQVDGVRCLIQHNSDVSVNQTAHILQAQHSWIIDAFDIDSADYQLRTKTYSDISVMQGDVFFFHLRSVRTHNFDNVNWEQVFTYSDNTSYSSADDYICYSDSRFAFQSDSAGTVVINTDVACPANTTALLKILVDEQPVDSIALSASVVHCRKELAYQKNTSVSLELSSSGNLGLLELRPYLAYTPLATDTVTWADSTWLIPRVMFARDVQLDSVYYNLFGPLYKGWGQFAFNNTDDEDAIPIHALRNAAMDYARNAPTDSLSFCQSIVFPASDTLQLMQKGGLANKFDSAGIYNPLGNAWIQMMPDMSQYRWEAYGRVARNGRHLLSNTRDTKRIVTALSPDNTVELEDIPEFDSDVPVMPVGRRAMTVRKKSETEQWNINAGIGVLSLGIGKTCSGTEYKVLTDFMDMNGDGYPDVIRPTTVQYTQPWGGLGQNKSVGVGAYTNYSTTSGTSLSGNQAWADKIPGINGEDGKFYTHVNGSLSGSHTDTRSEAVLAYWDMNGDGLPDKLVHSSGNNVLVYLNMGYGFAPPFTLSMSTINENTSTGMGASMGVGGDMFFGPVEEVIRTFLGQDYQTLTSKFQLSLAFGADINSSDNRLTARLVDMNGDGTPDVVQKTDNGILIGFMHPQGILHQSMASGEIQKSRTLNYGLNLGVTVGIPIWFFKICFGINGSPLGGAITKVTHDLTDMNGDGLPDLVWSDGQNIYVRYNQLGKNRLLKTVTNPTGQKFELKYELSAPTYERRGRQWLLSSVYDIDPHANPVLSPDTLKRTYAYSDPHYDYAERQFLGYGTTVSAEFNTDTLPNTEYRKTTRRYNNTDFIEHGKLTYECLTDAANHPFIEHEIGTWYVDSTFTPTDNLCGDASVKIGSEVYYTRYYEGGPERIVAAKKYDYDQYHNVVQYFNYGDSVVTDDNLRATIEYDPSKIDTHNLISLPSRMVVYNNDTAVRELNAEYNSAGLLTELRKTDMLNVRTDTTNYHYDAFGLPDTVFFPANYKGDRAFTIVGYDTATHILPALIADHWGRTVRMTYDVFLQLPRSKTNPAGNTSWFTYDGVGRLMKVMIPNDTLNHFTSILYTYMSRSELDSSAFLFQKTDVRLRNPEWPDIQQYSYCDHRGNLIYKKEYRGNIMGNYKWIVRDISAIDCFGRTKKTFRNYMDYCENGGEVLLKMDSLHLFTTLNYDIQDRQTDLMWQNNTRQTCRYTIGNDAWGISRLEQIITDENNHTQHLYTSPQGWLTTSVLPDNNTTSFKYDALGQLIASTDPDNLTTSYLYDGLGRQTGRHHPDAGTSLWTYDNAGNMIASATQQQINDSTRTTYEYDFNRLKIVHYPLHPQLDVHYEYDSINRISKRTDITGQEEFRYDVFDNVSVSDRLLVVPTENNAYRFRTQFKYDALGRICEIDYPDGEHLEYCYGSRNLEQVYRVEQDTAYPFYYIKEIKYNADNQEIKRITGKKDTTIYVYNPDRRWLTCMKTFSGNQVLQDLHYSYDSVGNITNICQNADTIGLLGGTYTISHRYDSLYRLARTDMISNRLGIYNDYAMTYSPTGMIGTKLCNEMSWNLWHGYCRDNSGHIKNHQVRSIFDNINHETAFLQWDADGRLHAALRPCSGDWRHHWWNEAGLLTAVADNTHCSYYGYDGNGNRAYKLTGQSLLHTSNDSVNFQMKFSDAVVYVNPYMVVTPQGYTKHYYNGTQRIATGIGNIANLPNDIIDSSAVAMERIANARSYLMELLDSSEVLTSDTTSVFVNIEGNALPQLQWQWANVADWTIVSSFQCDSDLLYSVLSKDSALLMPQVNGTYFCHPDHLGSATWITNSSGQPVEYIHYMPYGELRCDQRTSTYNERFKFTGKERDSETGYDYFGARYYSSALPMWLSVDPLSGDYPNISPYAYCHWNPVRNIDIDGKADYYDMEGNYIGKDNVNNNLVYQQNINGNKQYGVGVFRNPNFTYRGNVKELKFSYDGKMNKDNHMAKGILTIYQCGDDFEFKRAEFEAVSGLHGAKQLYDCLPNGAYMTNNYRERTDNVGFINDGVGFSIDLLPLFSTNRTDLRIHPDGGFPGTKGCIGLSGEKSELQEFIDIVTPFYLSGAKIKLNVNIFDNPNYHHY